MFEKEKKIKKSIDFTRETNRLLQDYQTLVGAPSVSSIVNMLTKTFVGLSDPTKEDLSEFCYGKIAELKKESTNTGLYTKNIVEREIDELSVILLYLTDGKGYNKSITNGMENMRRIDLAGGYVLFPDTWIVLADYSTPARCKNAFVIEFLHSTEYNLPHFIFFSEKDEITRKDEKDLIQNYCSKASSKVADVEALYMQPYWDKNGKMLNAAEVKSIPVPGIFKVPEWNKNNIDYPYGAMVVRMTRKETR